MARIGVLCDREFYHPFDQRVYKSALSLQGAGHVVELVTPHPTTKTSELEGLKVHCVSTTGPPGATALRMLRQALRGRYDLFYCHELDPLLYGLLLRPLTHRPLIWDCHEYLVQMKRELQGPLAARLTDLALELAAPRAAAIVTVDNRLARRLARWGPVTVLANYPRRADFRLPGPPTGTAPPSAPSRAATGPHLLYVGSLTERRGTRQLLEAFRLLRRRLRVYLEVAGGFNDPALEAWARQFDREEGLDILWHGWVDHRELVPLLVRADLGLFLNQPSPRYLKGVPTKLFEYLLCGLPVLAAEGPMIHRLLARGPCGATVDPTDPAAIARALEELLADPQLEAMGERGRRLVLDHYTWEAREARLLALVDRVLKAA